MLTLFLLASHLGTYTGDGVWRDEASESRRYRVEMRLEALPGGEIQQWFKHTFFEEGGSVIEQTLVFKPQSNGIFSAALTSAPISGRGYCTDQVCHYTLKVPSNPVEGTLLFLGDGRLRIFGSAEKNAQGRFIWWEEELRLQQ